MKKQLGIRLNEETVEHLDELARLMNASRATMLETLIEAEYDRVQGNPRAKALLEALRAFADTVQALGGEEPSQEALPIAP